MTLLRRTCVVRQMLEDEPNRRHPGDEGEDASHKPSDIVRLEIDLAIGEEWHGVGGRLPLMRARRVEAHHGVADAVDTLFELIVLGR